MPFTAASEWDPQKSRTMLIASGILFLLNGVAALVTGILVYMGWPSSSFSILGLFFGINLVMRGAAQFALAFGPRAQPAAA